MKPQPLAITLLEQRARAHSKGLQTGRAFEDGVACHFYPRSRSFAWWVYSRKCPKGSVIEHLKLQDSFRRQA